MDIVVPCRGEFGLKIRYHVPAVHAMEGPKIVYMEPGEECLYPSATELRTVLPIEDDMRRGTHPRGDWNYIRELREQLHRENPLASVIQTHPKMPEARFVPEPFIPQGLRDIKVVICPRGRRYGAAKNWPHWEALTDLPGVFAAGAPDSSLDLQVPRAWDHARFLDASVEAIRQASLVIATDAGLAHLALLCGTPLLLITHQGLVAPGPVLDPDGREMEPHYWPVRLSTYYHPANHCNVPIVVWEWWDDPEGVKRMAESLLECYRGSWC